MKHFDGVQVSFSDTQLLSRSTFAPLMVRIRHFSTSEGIARYRLVSPSRRDLSSRGAGVFASAVVFHVLFTLFSRSLTR